jgi:hypothetical protein
MALTKPDQKFQEEQIVGVGSDGDPIIIPARVRNVTLAALPGAGGACTPQFTLAKLAEIIDAPGSVDWIAWDAGSVSTPTAQANIGTVTAVRLTAVTINPAKMQVAGDPT